MAQRLDTAHRRWNRWWGEAKHRARWSDPEPAVVGLIPSLQTRGAIRVLDVGAGIGRHSLALADAGFDVLAVDASQTGLDQLTVSARRTNFSIQASVAEFVNLPMPDASVDHVLAWNVLYHGDGEIVMSALRECRRVLRPGGSIQVTMLSKRHKAFGVGSEVRPDTFVDESSDGDKDHPHFYVDATGLVTMLAIAGFDVLSLADVDQDSSGSFHWVAHAEVVV